MAEKSTIYEVARRSGVSTATVSRVMRAGTGFSPGTRQRVLDVAAELGWVPNGTARGLAVRRAGIVGLLFPDLGVEADVDDESPLFVDQVIRGAERAATRAGDAVLIAGTNSATGRELALAIAGKVDGLVIAARSLPDRDVTAIARSVPVVLIAAPGKRRTFDAVAADNRGGARAITRHLVLEHRYRDIAFVGGPARSPDSMERFAGFREALAEAGLTAPAHPDAGGAFTEAGGHRAMSVLLEQRARPPRAVVFGNDEMAIGALAAAREHRLRVPGDIAITGFDDIASARHVRPQLTTVRQPMREIGEEAVRTLLNRLRDPDGAHHTITLPTELVLRASCGCRRSPGRARTGRNGRERNA